jgi:hypothetical protein
MENSSSKRSDFREARQADIIDLHVRVGIDTVTVTRWNADDRS